VEPQGREEADDAAGNVPSDGGELVTCRRAGIRERVEPAGNAADRTPLDELREHRPRHAGSFKIAAAGHAFATEKRPGLGFGSVHGAGAEREMRDLRFLGTFA
jgi:hypothetical protein